MEFLSDVGGGDDLHRPSFFELAAQDQLRDLLAPVVRYVLSVFAQRNPRYLLRIVNKHDEFFALVMFFVERHYLKTWGASFAENFYGLKRRRVLPGGGDETRAAVALTGRSDKLRAREIRLSLVFLILVPYVRAKAQDWYERLGGGADSDLFRDSPQAQAQGQTEQLPLRTRLAAALREAFKKGYPWANMAYEVYLLSYNIRYLFGHTPHWRPWLSWMGVEVRRMTQDDYRAAQTATQSLLQSPFRPLPSGLPPSYATIAARAASLVPLASFEALKFALPTSIFFFRFLEWWYSPEGGHARLRRRGGGSLGNEGPPLRAPRKPAIGEEERKRAVGRGECCVPTHEGRDGGREVVNATALPTGWVGCYKCVHGWVEERGSCPVTGVRVEVGQLRKVMG